MAELTQSYKFKNERLHFLFAFLIQIGLLVVCMFMHRIAVAIGSNIQAIETVGGQETSPTLGRFIFLFIAFIGFIVTAFFAFKQAKKEQIYLPFALGTLSGTFLWQFLGEDVWHFSIDGMHLVQLESISVLPLAIVFVIAFFYIRFCSNANWGIWSAILSFATNWMGHYVLECTGVPFKGIISSDKFMVYVGCILGSILMIVGLLFGLKKSRTVKQRFEMSVLCYFAMALIAFSIMEG